ncbi:uncharacterized protein LOC129582704 [Paramacrobiotus metropolitanus]|uniref:uncharacterized protein LOC129582704 n=1 Tax=Paramacrobiotus metropolitanus TaxID=2943436 RepID=UPI002445AD2A|nr:uncharacterized protein LOC129582704 [Paramacrobiotus metropolitanus]XP_055330273.1 uncharacterized protein LOC129582704 [Paramacrobiotus metropolitanus]
MGRLPKLAIGEIIRRCFHPVSTIRISAAELLQVLQRKEVMIVFLACSANSIRNLLVFDPLAHCHGVHDKMIGPAHPDLTSYYWIQLAATEDKLIFIKCSDDLAVEFRLWNIGKGFCRKLKPSARVYYIACPIIVDHKIYFWDYFNVFYAMDISTGIVAWPKVHTSIINIGLAAAQAVTKHGHHIFYATTLAVLRYDTVADKWESLPGLPEWRMHFAMSVVTGYLYIMGGEIRVSDEDETIPTACCIRLNLQTAEWEEMEPLQQPRCCHTACVVENKIYVYGGLDAAGWHALTIESYATKQKTGWSTVALLEKDIQLLSDFAENFTVFRTIITAVSFNLDGAIPPCSFTKDRYENDALKPLSLKTKSLY